MSEVWRPIVDPADCGEVSNMGRVRGRYGKMRTTFVSRNGYKRVGLKGGKITVAVHILVASAFCGQRQDGLWVNHIDGNKLNNCSQNLEWVTASQNVRHAIETGLRPRKTTKEVMPQEALPDALRRIASGETQRSVAKLYGITPSSLCGRIKRYKEAQLCL